MFRTELLLILPLVVAVTVGQACRGSPCYGTPNVWNQKPQPIYKPPHAPTSPPLKSFQCKEGNRYHSVEHECDTYIECKQNRAMKYACPDGLHFNSAAKHNEYPCAHPSKVKCTAGHQQLTVGQACRGNPYYGTPNVWNQKPQPIDKQKPLLLPEKLMPSPPLKSFQCKEGNRYHSVEHECDTYIECKQNRAMKYACPDGLHFNPAAKHNEYPCAHPSKVKCTAGDPELTVGQACRGNPYYGTPNVWNQKPQPIDKQKPLLLPEKPMPSPPLKSFQCKEGNRYHSVEHECDTYIECKQNRAMKYACPDGLHFNPAAKHNEYPCAHPSKVKCTAGDPEQNATPTDKCPNQYGYYSTNDGDCSKFIHCREGLPITMNCPMGLVYNPETSTCDWPANVPSCNTNVLKDFTCPKPSEDEDQVSGIVYKYRYKGQCKQFVACQHGHPQLLSCERGRSFDDASQTCIDEDYVTDCSVAEHLQ